MVAVSCIPLCLNLDFHWRKYILDDYKMLLNATDDNREKCQENGKP